ncbi:DUF4179 domain-containing protein [Psychrobacillus soli]|uniref:DUF4179 domain-containing protein n=1 Tax=Psychrobacillus soli TaxID=1543965 RepID=A0A544T9T0_9BACI|nr:DUF4179 domain-containing protein [Psychrobacillus soli]TQR14189.1 DUF4179 domain-containing protein [Psychrobacillus soli]
MIPATTDPVSIAAIRENGGESIVDWINQHQQSFYILGSCYLSSQQQMEELFYRSILKIQKELPHFKNKTRFETWVTSIFIHSCRELSRDRSLQVSVESATHQGGFKALAQLQRDEKIALVLTYGQGFSQEEAASLLQVSADKMRELLFSGIQSLRNEIWSGSTFNGCLEYQKDYLDYLDRRMERSKKIDLEVHIYGCPQCQEELANFQDIISTLENLTDKIEDLHMPILLMENVKEKLKENEKQRQQKHKKRKRIGLVFASVFVLLIGIGFFTGTFANLYYSWSEEDPQLRAFLQQDLGERLNLEAESEGVKITIKSVIADDVQTLVFYEIEDTVEDSQFMMNYGGGVSVWNEYEIMDNGTYYPKYYPPDLDSDLNNKEKSVYRGKLSLMPLKTEKATIELSINNLHKLNRDSPEQQGFWDYGNNENKTGDWKFEIPVTKQPSVEYALDEVIEIEGIPIRFDKLTIAPTVTIIQFGINRELPEKLIEFVDFNNLEVNNKKVKADMNGTSFVNWQQDSSWSTLQTQFDPLFGEIPKEVNVQLKSVQLYFNDKKTVELDVTPERTQTFEYAGSTISVDMKEDETSTEFVISNYEVKNRAYEWLNFNFVDENGEVPSITEMNSDAIIVDKNGVQYDMNQNLYPYDEIEQPHYFNTLQSARFQGEKMIPKKLEIYGYQKTKYLDDVLKISLE